MLAAIGLEVHKATLYILAENFVGVIGQSLALVLQWFTVFNPYGVEAKGVPAGCPGPAIAAEVAIKEENVRAEENNSFKGPLVYNALVNWFSHGIVYPEAHRSLSRRLAVDMMEEAEKSWQVILQEDRVEEIRRAKLMAYKVAYDYKVYGQGSLKDVSPERVIGENKLNEIKKMYPRQVNEYIETYNDLESYVSNMTSSR